MRFFVPSNRRAKGGEPTHLDGLNDMVAVGRSRKRGYASRVKKENGLHVEGHCREAMHDCGWETPSGKCLVTLTFVEVDRRRDPDNIFGGAKYILDGITRPRGRRKYGAGAIVDDSQKWIELRFGEILVDRDRPGCWVDIEEIADGVQEPSGRRD